MHARFILAERDQGIPPQIGKQTEKTVTVPVPETVPLVATIALL
jgi:hypothetical protein